MYEYIRYPVFMLSKSVKNLISVGGVENICHQLTPICLNFKVQVEYKSRISWKSMNTNGRYTCVLY